MYFVIYVIDVYNVLSFLCKTSRKKKENIVCPVMFINVLYMLACEHDVYILK